MLGNATLPDSVSRRSLRRLRIVGVSIVVAAMAIAATAGTTMAWAPGAFSPSDEQLLFALTNQDRASAGLNALVEDTYLHNKAEWRAQDMGDRDYFSHQIPPTGSMVFDSMTSDGYCYKVAGENIGLSTYGDDTATSSIEVAFMGSPTHRENILGTWAHMGIGAYKAADGRKLYSVLFSIPCGVSVATPPPAAPPVPTEAPVVKPPAATVKPVVKATARPVVVVTPAPTPTPTPVPTDTPMPTATPEPSPTPVSPATPVTAGPSSAASPAAAAGGVAATAPSSLRVREKAVSQSPMDSFFHSLFGGLFGW